MSRSAGVADPHLAPVPIRPSHRSRRLDHDRKPGDGEFHRLSRVAGENPLLRNADPQFGRDGQDFGLVGGATEMSQIGGRHENPAESGVAFEQCQ